MSRLVRVSGPAGPGAVAGVDPGGHRQVVSLLAYDGPEPTPGRWLVCHSGYALAALDDDEAARRLALEAAAGGSQEVPT